MVERKPVPEQGRDGFLSRWSRRKAEVRQGVPLADPLPTAPEQEPAADAAPVGAADTRAPSAPLPTLADVQALTSESDFAPFMSRGVAPGVRNAAMKKLFADPHYNVMDGLDIYIDDYTKTTPLTLAMVKSMTSATFLGLFDHEEQKHPEIPADAAPAATARDDGGREDADAPDPQGMAHSGDSGDALTEHIPPEPGAKS